MSNNRLLYIILSLFLIVFNVLFFTLGDNESRNVSLWLSYGFIHFAYLIFVLSIFVIKKSPGQNAYDASTTYVTWKYFTIEFVVGLLFIWLNFEGYALALSVQIIIAGVAIALWIAHLMANAHTAESMIKQKQEINYLRDCTSRLKGVMNEVTSDRQLYRKVEQCYEELSSSPTHSNATVSVIERNISDTIKDLEDAIYSGNTRCIDDLTSQIMRSIRERNRTLKINR